MEPSRDIRLAEARPPTRPVARNRVNSVEPPSQVNYRANRQNARAYWLPGNQDREHAS